MFWIYNLLIINDINESCNIASELSMVFSTSRNSRPHRQTGLKLSPGGERQPKLLSTIQRFFSGTNPRLLSGFCGPPLRCNFYFPVMLPFDVLNETDFIAMIRCNSLQPGYFSTKAVNDEFARLII